MKIRYFLYKLHYIYRYIWHAYIRTYCQVDFTCLSDKPQSRQLMLVGTNEEMRSECLSSIFFENYHFVPVSFFSYAHINLFEAVRTLILQTTLRSTAVLTGTVKLCSIFSAWCFFLSCFELNHFCKEKKMQWTIKSRLFTVLNFVQLMLCPCCFLWLQSL